MIFISRHTAFFVLAAGCFLNGCARFHSGDDATAASRETSLLAGADQSPPEAPASSSSNLVDTVPDTVLAWDAKVKTYHAKVGEERASFTFNVTNVSPTEVVIEDTSTSCGCTVAELPADPWKLLPGAHGQIQVTMEFNGQIGNVAKEVTVFTSKGIEVLTVETIIPEAVYPNMAK